MADPQQQNARDAQYRAALGLRPDEPLPAQLGAAGGSRGGHGVRSSRINQRTNGRPAPWNIEARRAAARRVASLDLVADAADVGAAC